MAITFNHGAVLGNNGGSSGLFSVSFTVNTGGSLVVYTETSTAANSGQGYVVSYNGVNLLGPLAINSTNWLGALWFLLSPATGSNTLSIQYGNNTVSQFMALYAAEYDGVLGYDTSATSTDGTSETTYSSSFSASKAGYTVIAIGRNDGVGGDTPSVASPFTARFGNTSGSGFIWSDDIGASSPVTFSATINQTADAQDHYFISLVSCPHTLATLGVGCSTFDMGALGASWAAFRAARNIQKGVVVPRRGLLKGLFGHNGGPPLND